MDVPGSELPQGGPGNEAEAAAPADVATFSRDAAAYLKAWTRLLSSEAAVARINLTHLLIGALLVPAIAFATLVAVDAVLATLVFAVLPHWLVAAAIVLAVDAAALILVLRLLRSWWRTLSLPHSRQALTRLWSSHDDSSEERTGAPARRAA